jgi:hypothetical protein
LQDAENVNTKHNAVPLDTFGLLFYQLLEICNVYVAVRGMSLKEKKQYYSIFLCICTSGIFTGTVLCEHIFAFVGAL